LNLYGRYQLVDAALHADGMTANAYDGRLTANIDMKNLDGTPTAKMKVDLRNISLAAVQRSVGEAKKQRIEVSGVLNGSTEATWTGSPSDALVRAEFLIKKGSNETAPQRKRILPVDANLRATYDGKTGILTVAHSTLQVPAATITADGQI